MFVAGGEATLDFWEGVGPVLGVLHLGDVVDDVLEARPEIDKFKLVYMMTLLGWVSMALKMCSFRNALS